MKAAGLFVNQVNQPVRAALWQETIMGGSAMGAEVSCHPEPAYADASATSPVDVVPVVVATGLAASLAACGGGGEGSSATSASTPPTDAEASRFLAQATMGASRGRTPRVKS